MARLRLTGGPHAPAFLEAADGVLLGRDGGSALPLNDTEVSRRHARLHVQGPALVIEDLSSTNGTFVNDQRVDGRRRLVHGDSVRLGRTVMVVEAPEGTVVAPRPQVVPPRPVGYAPPAPARPLPPTELSVPRPQRRGVRISGLVLLAIGLFVAVVGIAVFVLSRESEGSFTPDDFRLIRTASLGVSGGGVLALIVGSLLLVASRRRGR